MPYKNTILDSPLGDNVLFGNLTITGKIINEFIITSKPPPGYYKVTNLYVDPETNKLVVIFNDIPTPFIGE